MPAWLDHVPPFVAEPGARALVDAPAEPTATRPTPTCWSRTSGARPSAGTLLGRDGRGPLRRRPAQQRRGLQRDALELRRPAADRHPAPSPTPSRDPAALGAAIEAAFAELLGTVDTVTAEAVVLADAQPLPRGTMPRQPDHPTVR